MGIRLINEVMDHAPRMTLAEWKAMIVLAEDANDTTRQTWSPTTADKITRRLDLAPHAWANLRGALVRKGLLEVVEAGRRGRCAKYRFPAWPPFRPRAEDETEMCPQGEDETEEMSPPPEDETESIGPQVEDASVEYVLQEVTPTPQNHSSEQNPSSPPPHGPQRSRATPEGGGGDHDDLRQENDHPCPEQVLSDLLRGQRPPTSRERRQLTAGIARALATDWSETGLLAALAWNMHDAEDFIDVWIWRLEPSHLVKLRNRITRAQNGEAARGRGTYQAFQEQDPASFKERL